METTPLPVQPAEKTSSGCLDMGLLGFLAAWIIGSTAVAQTTAWALEQSLFDGSFQVPDVRWLVALIYAMSVILPAAIIWYAVKTLPSRRFYLALMLAGLYVLLLVPARLAGITAALGTGLLQIAGGLAFWLVTLRRPRPVGTWHGTGLGLLLAFLVGYPWLIWGAFGSFWDIVLNLVAALLFGIGAARVVEIIFRPDETTPAGGDNRFKQAVAAALALLTMATGLGINGNQGLLGLSVPILALAMVGLYRSSTTADGRPAGNRRSLAALAGLAAFWPMALVDPDELAGVISAGAGELIQWANLAAAIAMLIGLVVGLILFFTRPRAERSPLALGAAGLAAIVGLGLYFFVGQPGLHGERLFVIFKEQADLSGAQQAGDYPARRAFVYNRLVETADASQAELRQAFDRLGIAYQPYYLENAIEVQAGPLVRLWLSTRPEVDRVLDSPILRPLPAPVPTDKGEFDQPSEEQWNLTMIGADRVWQELGVTGQGVIVGQSDTGVQGDHPELADSYRGGVGMDANDYNWFDPWYGSAAPTDIGGHGTHTLGTVLGNHTGVAPDAQWIGCVNLGRNLGNPAFYLDCMQFMLAPFPQGGDPLHDGDPTRGAHVLNNSWGCPPVEGCDPESLRVAVESLRAAGVFVVASAGNEGSLDTCSTLSDPIALYDAVYAVGAVDSRGELGSFSSTGPVLADGSGRTKPDIVAPGVQVFSSYPGSGYTYASGTSMAGPHVVGVVALMWSANPALIGDIERTEQILNETAAPFNGELPSCATPGVPNSAVGYGVVDAFAAVSRALAEK